MTLIPVARGRGNRPKLARSAPSLSWFKEASVLVVTGHNVDIGLIPVRVATRRQSQKRVRLNT
jgi:hypothetical protein